MKILLRNDLKWYDATFDVFSGKITYKKGVISYENEILAIKDDVRKHYLYCPNCGEYIKNNKRSIKAHLKKHENSKACMTCGCMETYSKNLLNKRYVLNEDGTYTEIKKTITELKCGATWPSSDINSDDARKKCKYKKCSEENMEKTNRFFIKYPDAFNEMITIDALNDEWKFSYYMSGKIVYKNPKINVNAVADISGIVTNFQFEFRENHFSFMYSKKYDKIFWLPYGEYDENHMLIKASKSTLDKLHQSISKLYKED